MSKSVEFNKTLLRLFEHRSDWLLHVIGAGPPWAVREPPIRNLQILPHYQQLTLVRARETRASAPVFVRAAVES